MGEILARLGYCSCEKWELIGMEQDRLCWTRPIDNRTFRRRIVEPSHGLYPVRSARYSFAHWL